MRGYFSRFGAVTETPARVPRSRRNARWSRLRTLLLPPLYILLLPLIVPTQIFSTNIGYLRFTNFLSAAAICLCGLLALRTVLRALYPRSELVDPLLATIFIGLVFESYVVPIRGLEPIWIALWFNVALLLWRLGAVRTHFRPVANIAAVILLAPAVVHIAWSPVIATRSEIERTIHTAFAPLPSSSIAAQSSVRRDIYYIILDRYGRADQLRNLYEYDNEPFLAALRDRGLAVADNAYANYQRTTHSLASTLNLDYLDAIDTAATGSSSDWVPLYGLVQDFRLGRFLTQNGYEFHFFGSWWEPTRRIPLADVNHSWRAWPSVIQAIFDNSLVGKAAQRLGLSMLDPRLIQCEREKRKFAEVPQAGRILGPQFVFAHVLLPHPPFVMTETGRCMDVAEASSRTREQNYIGQLRYANGALLRMIDQILAQGEPKPIIIVQGDEGPWPARYAGDEISRLGADVTAVDWRRASPAELREKMGILNALYLPTVDPKSVPNDATPVNTFRDVLRLYFGLPLDRLPERQFVFESDANLYHFHEVTEKLRDH
jgi:hypothetical protein